MKANRFPTDEKATIEVLGKNSSVTAKLHNISKTGACIDWAPESFALMKGDLIRMKVDLSVIKKSHHLNAEVVWANGRRSGLHFLNAEEFYEKMLIR